MKTAAELLEKMGFQSVPDGIGLIVSHPLIADTLEIPNTGAGLMAAHRWLYHNVPLDAIGRESAILRSRAVLVAFLEEAA